MNINDIFNRPPAISEDTLEYTLYPLDELSDKVSVTTLAAVMQSFVQSIIPDIIWHRDTFQLKIAPNEEEGKGYVLEGRMRVGDCVDDEWLAVWLLWQISSKWDVAISVSDSDGEFLLIEAAEHLPHWITPSNAENRVWIYQSHLHLIPLSHISAPSSKPRRRKFKGATKDSDNEGEFADADEDDYLSVKDALRVLRDKSEDTVAPQSIEGAVWKRIHGYPAAARQHIHYTKAQLPVDVAKALAKHPSLVQKAVETFYTRDAMQLRAAHKMSRFPPEPSVLTTVKMTRTAYAQLMGQKFYPPKIFGRWQEREGTPEWRQRDIGMKIACGFEMLYQESKNRVISTNGTSADAGKSSAAARKEALRRNPDYTKYIENLKSAGYFKGELEDSSLWNQLEDDAVNAFVEARKDDDATRTSFADEVNTAVALAHDQDYISLQAEDSDDWLNVDAADFDAMLEKTAGEATQDIRRPDVDAMDIDKKDETEEDRIANRQAEKLKTMAKKVEEFLETEADVEGARFQDEMFSDEEFDEGDSDHEDNDMDTAHIEEVEQVVRPQLSETERQARQEAMDKLVPGVDPSEYGKMPPSYHSNSQRVARTTIETDVIEEISTSGLGQQPELKKRSIRPPLLPRDKYEGVDSDDESEEEGEGDSEEDEQPQVVGEIEIDMEEEEEEFLEFARQALGLSDDQWNDIMEDRRGRKAYVPSTVVKENKTSVNKRTKTTSTVIETTSSEALREPAAGPRPRINPDLDSFEAVMQAMDAELSRSKGEKPRAPADNGKGKTKAVEIPSGEDIEAAMDAELKAAIVRGEGGEDMDENMDEKLDYNLIKNFLESFRSQGGLSGPVSNLVGRLQPDWKLPRDSS